MFKFITHKSFFINLLAAVGLLLLLAFIFFSSLDYITRHNEKQKVPSVVGKNLAEAQKILEAGELVVSVQDSVYIDTAAPLAVIRQSPDADAEVKVHRTVYLTVNRAVPPSVEMPDLRGFSLKSAELYLQSIGLKRGDVTSTPDIARNAVKEQLYHNKAIAPGTKINMGSVIDFIIGSGIGQEAINVPDMVGMKVLQARLFLSNKGISIGSILVQGSIADTANAFIIQQSPLPFSTIGPGEVVANKINPGQIMDIWISNTPPAKDTSSPYIVPK